MSPLQRNALFGLGIGVALLAAAFHFRYLFMETELRRGTLVFDQRGLHGECHLIDTKQAARTQWPVREGFGSKPLSDEVFAQMIRISDGLEVSFCDDHPELLNQEIAIRGVRSPGAMIGQDCSNRSCFRWVRLER